MLYPELAVKQGKTFTSLSGEAFSVSASHNYCGIEGRFKAVKISYCPDVSKYGRKVAAGQEGLTWLSKVRFWENLLPPMLSFWYQTSTTQNLLLEMISLVHQCVLSIALIHVYF